MREKKGESNENVRTQGVWRADQGPLYREPHVRASALLMYAHWLVIAVFSR